MKYILALILAGIGLSPALATDFATVGNWSIWYDKDICSADAKINGTAISVQYAWSNDHGVVALSNPNWTVPKEVVQVKFAFKSGNEDVATYDGPLTPDSDHVVMATPNGTEIITLFYGASSYRVTLADGTLLVDLPLSGTRSPMVTLLICVNQRRVADPFNKPAPMKNQYVKGGEYK